jgi:hypothetical protein
VHGTPGRGHVDLSDARTIFERLKAPHWLERASIELDRWLPPPVDSPS